MISIKRTNSNDLDFQKLVEALDIDLGAYYKDEKQFYGKLNNIDEIKYAVVVYDENNNLMDVGELKLFRKMKLRLSGCLCLLNLEEKVLLNWF